MNPIARIIPPLVVMGIGIGALLSMACGIIAAPVAVPELLFTNSRVAAQVDVVGLDHLPLTDVDVHLVKYYKVWDLLFITLTEKREETFHTDETHPLLIDRYGYYEITATISKKGYQGQDFTFYRGPNRQGFSGGFNYYEPQHGTPIDINAKPRIVVILNPETPAATIQTPLDPAKPK